MKCVRASILALIGALLFGPTAEAAQIKLLSSNAVRQAYVELIPAFEKATGHHVTVTWTGATDLKNRVNSGAAVDVIITPSADIDELVTNGKVVSGTRIDLAKSSIGVAVATGVPKPALSSGEQLKTALLAAKSIIISGGPSGSYLLNLFEKQAILPALRPKLKQLASGESVGEALARREGEIGFTQVSEFQGVKGIVYAGPLPADVQQVTVFSSGILNTAPEPDAAEELVHYLNGPQAILALRKNGLEPGS